MLLASLHVMSPVIFMMQLEVPHQMKPLNLGLPSIQNHKKYISFLSELPSLLYSAIATSNEIRQHVNSGNFTITLEKLPPRRFFLVQNPKGRYILCKPYTFISFMQTIYILKTMFQSLKKVNCILLGTSTNRETERRRDGRQEEKKEGRKKGNSVFPSLYIYLMSQFKSGVTRG